jgi:putative sigma-54 modulation protein
MKIQVKGRHVVVTDPLREYAEEKLARLHRLLNERHIDDVTLVELDLIVEKSHPSGESQIAEATIFTRGPVLRARESSSDMYAAIDLVSEKLQRRVKKYHDKLQHKALRRHPAKPLSSAATPAEAIADEAAAQASAAQVPQPVAVSGELEADGSNHHEEPRVVKSKQFALKPMSIDEATLQLELIGHSFFVFTNAETNDTNVVYRRRDGDFGLIEPVRS